MVLYAPLTILDPLISLGVRDGPFHDQRIDNSFAPASFFPFGLGSAVPRKDDFSFKAATKMRAQMVYKLNEKSTRETHRFPVYVLTEIDTKLYDRLT
jgi:hypothetical protein